MRSIRWSCLVAGLCLVASPSALHAQADLAVTMTASPDAVAPEGLVTFTLEVTNTTPDAIQDVVVGIFTNLAPDIPVDVMPPAGFAATSHPTCFLYDCSPEFIGFTVPSLAGGGETMLSVVFRALSPPGATIRAFGFAAVRPVFQFSHLTSAVAVTSVSGSSPLPTDPSALFRTSPADAGPPEFHQSAAAFDRVGSRYILAGTVGNLVVWRAPAIVLTDTSGLPVGPAAELDVRGEMGVPDASVSFAEDLNGAPGAMVAWSRQDQVFARGLAPATGGLTALGALGPGRSPFVAAAPDGHFVVLWNSPDETRLLARRIGSGAQPAGDAVTVLGGGGEILTGRRLVANPVTGEVGVAFTTMPTGSDPGTVDFARVALDGTVLSRLRVAYYGGGPRPAIAANARTGGYVIVWSDRFKVFGAELDRFGNLLSRGLVADGVLEIVALTFNDVSETFVAVGYSGGSRSSVRMLELNQHGAPLSAPTPVELPLLDPVVAARHGAAEWRVFGTIGQGHSEDPRRLASEGVGTLSPRGGSDGRLGAPPPPAFGRTSLAFGAINTGVGLRFVTTPQPVRVSQVVDPAASWTASPSEPWIHVSPASGTGPAELLVSVGFAPGLPMSGTVTGAVTLVSDGAAGPSSPLEVTLRLFPPAASAPPWGALETPLQDAAGVAGSLAVTGWALDDVEVAGVRILRDAVAGEGDGPLFVGQATFVEGARPDVGTAFPLMPRSTRAGWGYLLLTNMLPNGGNGTFRLHVYADDAEGNSTLLGTRTITVDNANAVKPFGAIDTPGQGQTVSGLVNNFGWVLGRGTRRADPPGGGTVTVFVNGTPVGAPFGWTSRSDLSALFPVADYAGIHTAAGVFPLDTTTLADGVHTIAWSVTDSEGATDGIGSRYFTVANGGAGIGVTAGTVRLKADTTAPVASGFSRTDSVASAFRRTEDVAALARETRLIMARRGFDLEAPFRPVAGGVIDGEELDRFEVRLPAGVTTGHLRVGENLGPLPIGSRLDPAAGTFTWQPGVGFIGPYDFAFGAHGLRIVLHPKGSSRVGPQVMIDTPAPGTTLTLAGASGVSRPILIAGWALDLDDPVDTGVNTLHVWAYPVDEATGQRPRFLGVTSYGGARPDVAAVFGDRYLRTGYGLLADGLEPGTYDIAVFAWSTVRNAFVPARVVRVHVR